MQRFSQWLGARIDRTTVDEKWNATEPSEVDDSFRAYFEKVKKAWLQNFMHRS